MSIDQLNRTVHLPKSSTEQCSICLEDFTNQEIGIPEHCEHSFCFPCLITWAKKNNTCPSDRQIFQYIFKKHSFTNRKPYAKVNINNDQLEIYLEENFISCHVCGDDDQEYPLLTCTRCNNGFHTFCLNSYDTSTWMCPSCEYNHGQRTKIHTKSVNTSLMVKRARTQIRRPRRRLQRLAIQNIVRKVENPITRNINSSSSTVIQTQKNRSYYHFCFYLILLIFSGNKPSIRSIISPDEAARRIAASGIPIVADPRTTALISQVKNMAALKRKRQRFARLPPRIPINQLPRIQRRADVPPRPRPKSTTTQKSNSLASASFIDKLLHSQKHLYSLENVRMQGAHIKLS